MELSDNIIYTAMQRLVMIHYQKIVYADLTDDTYFVLKTTGSDWNLNIENSKGRKLSEWFTFFIKSPLCHEDDKKHLEKILNVSNLKETFEKNNNQTIVISYRRKFDNQDVEFHLVTLEIIPDISKSGHLIIFMFVHDITNDEKVYSAKLQTFEENKKFIQHNLKSGKRKILIVEDDKMNMSLLKNMLEDEYEIMEAQNGLLGLEILADNYKKISAILLDIYMPIVSGFEFLEKINKDSMLSNIPIIVTTVSETSKDEEKCLRLGAADFIKKPYNPQVLKMKLDSIIKMSERSFILSSIEFDDLTGLYTKEAFYHHAEKLFKENPDISFDLILSTLDNLNQISEQYGDNVGRQIVSHIGNKLALFKQPKMILSRIRDGIFANLMVHSEETDSQRLLDLVETFTEGAITNDIITKFAVYKNVDKTLPVSVITERTLSALESITHKIDKNVVYYDNKIIYQQKLNAEMEENFESSLENGDFEIWFQPKYSASTQSINGAEALIRWRNKDGSLIPPNSFIPLFERDGLIKKLDEYVFSSVCEYQRKRLEKGLKVIPISINLSRVTIFNTNLAPQYSNIVEDYEIPKNIVPIEITESAAFLSRDIKNFADPFNKYGFELHMDDFGSGYSSLASLQFLHFDTIKLDKSLVNFIGTQGGDSLLRHTISFAKETGINVVAEGVETEEQFNFLKTSNCDTIQGYYFSKPLPLKEFDEIY